MPRASKNHCKEEVKLKLKQLGHVKCCSDRKPHQREGKWLNCVMKDNTFKDEKIYRVCDSFIRRHISSIDYGKSKSTLHIQNNQPDSICVVKVSVAGEAILKIYLRPIEGVQPSKVVSTFSDLI